MSLLLRLLGGASATHTIPVATGTTVSTAASFSVAYVLPPGLVNATAPAPVHTVGDITHVIPAATVTVTAVAPISEDFVLPIGGLVFDQPLFEDARHLIPTASIHVSAVPPKHRVLDPVLASVGISAVQLAREDEEALVAYSLLTPF